MTFSHEALYYNDVDGFLVGAMNFVRAGVHAREPVLVGLVEPRLSLLRRRLGVDGQQVRFVDMTEEGRNPNRILPWLLRAFVDRHPGRVRVLGEPIYPGRPVDEVAGCVQHEALINLAFAERDTAIMCPYDVRQLPHLVPYAERTHPWVFGTLDERGGLHGGRRPSKSYTDPYTVVALFNQPLPDRRRVDEDVVFDVQGLSKVRRVVGAYAGAAGLTADRVADLQLAVTEIGTNAVTHTGEASATLRLWAEPDRVVAEIRGAGQISDIMAGRVIPSNDSPRGRGLLIANRLCDLVQTHSAPTGTTTRLHMRVSPT